MGRTLASSSHVVSVVLLFSLSVASDSLWTPWTVVFQAPLSMGFPRQENWSGLLFLLQGIFLTQGQKPCLLHSQVDSLPLSHWESPLVSVVLSVKNRKSTKKGDKNSGSTSHLYDLCYPLLLSRGTTCVSYEYC